MSGLAVPALRMRTPKCDPPLVVGEIISFNSPTESRFDGQYEIVDIIDDEIVIMKVGQYVKSI